MTETQTGFQRRSPEQQIDPRELRSSLSAIHAVGNAEYAAAHVCDPTLAFLDLGERALWAHALTRNDAWVLCGPDKASLRFGVRLGLRDRLVALESLLEVAGHQPRISLRTAYTARWSDATLAELVLSEGPRRS